MAGSFNYGMAPAKHGLLSADILYSRKMKSRNSRVTVTRDTEKYKETDEAKQKKNQRGLGHKSCHHFIAFHGVPASGNKSFKGKWCHLNFLTVMWIYSPLADSRRVSGDAVTSARVGREVNGVSCQNQWPLGCSQTVPVPVSGAQSQAQSQARALQVLKAH